MDKELKKKMKEIMMALYNASDNVTNMCSGNAPRDAALYHSMLYKIKDEMIPHAVTLCEEGTYEPKHILEKIDRNIWAMDFTILQRLNELTPDKVKYLSNWIKRYAEDIKVILLEEKTKRE